LGSELRFNLVCLIKKREGEANVSIKKDGTVSNKPKRTRLRGFFVTMQIYEGIIFLNKNIV